MKAHGVLADVLDLHDQRDWRAGAVTLLVRFKGDGQLMPRMLGEPRLGFERNGDGFYVFLAMNDGLEIHRPVFFGIGPAIDHEAAPADQKGHWAAELGLSQRSGAGET